MTAIVNNPGFILTTFQRQQGAPEADGLEKFGNFACGLLHLSFGREISVSKAPLEQAEDAGLHVQELKSSVISRIVSIAIYILTLPISLTFTIAGAISLACSKSYHSLFDQLFSANHPAVEITPSDQGCETATEAVGYLIEHPCQGADLRQFKDLNNEHLIQLAKHLPELKTLRVYCKNLTKVPDQFKHLEELECHNCNESLKLPDSLSSLKTLKIIGGGVNEWPSDLQNLETLHLFESWCQILPPNLKSLKEFNCFNSPHFSTEALEGLPETCNVISELPKDMQWFW